MNAIETPLLTSTQDPGLETSDLSIVQLLGQVYEAAPATEQGRLLELLLRPLGVLSLVAVANGTFAKIRFRSGWPELHVRLEDAAQVRAADVIALADHVQQVSVEAIDSVAQLLASSALMATSAAAVLLVTVLAHRARSRRASDSDAVLVEAAWD